MLKVFSIYMTPVIFRQFIGILITVPLTTYYLNTDDIGKYIAISIILTFMGGVVTISPSLLLQKHIKNFENKKFSNEISNLVFGELLIKLVGICIFFFTSKILKNELLNNTIILVIVLGTAFFSSSWPITARILVLSEKPKVHACIELMQSITQLSILYIALKFLDLGYISLAIAPLVASVVSFLMELYILLKYGLSIEKLNTKKILDYIKNGIPLTIAGAAEYVSNISDRFFLQRVISYDSLAIYAHSQIYGNSLKIFNKAIFKTISPSIVKNINEDVLNMRQQYIYLLNILPLFFIAGGLFLGVNISLIIDILTHEKLTESSYLVKYWYALAIFQFSGYISFQYLLSKGKNKLYSQGQFIVSVISIIFMAIISGYGKIDLMALTVVISNLILQIIMYRQARKNGMLRDVFFYKFILTGLISFLIFLYFESLTINTYHRIFSLASLILIFIKIYFTWKKNE